MQAAISQEVRDKIGFSLDAVEDAHDVRIVFAVESGSRAWGFPSPDSDYDVRFVYVRPAEWYLSLEKQRDVIELPIKDAMDINGWDIKKALPLLLKGNPALLEWLQSPFVYRRSPCVDDLASLAERINHRKAAGHHYLHLGLNAFRSQIAGRDRVQLKKYFYCLRPALALLWSRTHSWGRIPMDMPTLLAGVELPPSVWEAIDGLLEAKERSSEIGEGNRIPVLDAFLEMEFSLARARAPRPPEIDSSLIGKAQVLFLKIVLGEAPDR